MTNNFSFNSELITNKPRVQDWAKNRVQINLRLRLEKLDKISKNCGKLAGQHLHPSSWRSTPQTNFAIEQEKKHVIGVIGSATEGTTTRCWAVSISNQKARGGPIKDHQLPREDMNLEQDFCLPNLTEVTYGRPLRQLFVLPLTYNSLC
jgi:hypothetical protein